MQLLHFLNGTFTALYLVPLPDLGSYLVIRRNSLIFARFPSASLHCYRRVTIVGHHMVNSNGTNEKDGCYLVVPYFRQN
jgi:hypothetical protein